MTPVESAQIAQLTEELREFRADFRVFKTKLMGDDESEQAQGRIPRSEAHLSRLEARIIRVEKLVTLGRGATLLVAGILVLAELAYYVSKAVR
jgi:hypothetical protein